MMNYMKYIAGPLGALKFIRKNDRDGQRTDLETNWFILNVVSFPQFEFVGFTISHQDLLLLSFLTKIAFCCQKLEGLL